MTHGHVSKYLHVGHMASHVSPCIQVGRPIKVGGDQFVKVGKSRKEMRRKKEKREKGKKERKREGEKRKRERGRKGSRRSDGWNSSDQKVNSVYSMRATFQEVGILPTLVYFHSKGLFVKYRNAACFDPAHL